jgi:hypothetical protein
VVLAFLVGGVAGAAFSATFNVNSTFDVAAAPPLNNGICETAPGNGVCTLRAAVMKGNHFPGGNATINVPGNALPYKLTIVPAGANDETTGDLNITAAMTIVGAGIGATIIDGNATDRILKIQVAAGAATISGVTMRNGVATEGAGIYIDSGALILSNSAITGCNASYGGGIFSGFGSTVTLSGVALSDNTASQSGGGMFSVDTGSATINDSVVSNNTAGVGGGLLLGAATTVVNRSAVAGNRAQFDGGGIDFGGASAQTALVANSTINGNRAGVDGGGIHSFNTLVTIQNSTVSANAAHANGGGISQEGSLGGMRLFHVTVGGNLADSDRAAAGTGGGLYRAAGSSPNEVWNSLLVENSAGVAASDCAGDPTTSQDYNMFQTTFGCALTGVTTHNISSVVDPLLDGLQNNGEATLTRALLDSSPALDKIPSASCRDSLGVAPNPDQRGVVRPVGPQCDIGAYEGSKPASLLGRNLIRNGDAENGGGSTSGVFIRVPNWTIIQGQVTVVPYGAPGGFPSALTDLVPATRGYNFFAGGSADSSIARQSIAVVTLATAIDAGQVTYNMAGDFGGFANQEDFAALNVSFRDIASNTIGGSREIGHVSAADRGNATGFRHRTLSGVVPAGTRIIEVTVYMLRTADNPTGYNDGYADNLSLVLTSGTPPALQNAVSRKGHGAAGTFDLALSAIPTNPSTEPRQGPAQTIVFTFDKPINAATATITEGVATAAAPTFSGNEVSVSLSGVSNQQYVTVSLSNVASVDGGSGGSGSVRVGFLVGDVSQNRVVTVADLGLVNAQLAQPVTAANYLRDVNASGTLTVGDKGITNANLTHSLPAP